MKIAASHQNDDLRLFHLFRTSSAPGGTSFPYEMEHFLSGDFLLTISQNRV